MKTTLVLLLSAALCAGAVQAETTTTTQHVQIRVHNKAPRSQADKVHIKHGKFTVLPIGHQCAYDPKNDPSLYPCRDGGVCIRTSPTFGKCFSKEEAARFQSNANATTVDGSDDSDDDSDDDSRSASGSGSAVRARGPTVGDDEKDDEEDKSAEGDDADEDDEEGDNEEDDSVDVHTTPPATKA